ncbi:MAG: undecaprenyldiphospho-muramoylpentapeptide beta-N-acetylglucosaminyltransferase [Peptoniphilaceae bacterium]|nr:undecaprenyldiphospho-muramoylpentapeptide beta-N-acetylglucosaminyltransferase [Peptoniphilaceae bacterium]MDD7383585.1 undecaprenyldiphospho-muramoylpentapeptide beta-N-acetylglucosaminyltransferase [Peptoniphilaceae bacterium]MDY3738757.1 undecaprenyldiphospho-muramoylpentapeptide beta-N-acetylglucosaminyltransferase [Peptoniphilaceae bacterium]
MKVLISGGGTGGHIYPAIAIIQAIKEKENNSEFLYVGRKEGIEKDIIEKMDIPFIGIDAMGIPRKVSKKIFSSINMNLKGLKQAKKIIKDFNPDISIGTGGYVSAAVLYESSRKKIPTLIHESNSYPGITNKILSKFVDVVCVSFIEAKQYLKNSSKIVVTGNPVRKSFKTNTKENAYKLLNLNSKIPVVFSFGGSNGSYKLNKAIIELSEIMDGSYQLLHASGKSNFDDLMKEVKINENIKIYDYIDNIDVFYSVSDLIIASSGAMTLTEISSLEKPSILIPKAYTTENHQQKNAESYVKNNASLMILEKDLNGKILDEKIKSIIHNEEKLKTMGKAAKKMINENASEEIVDICIKLAKEKK